MCLQGLDNTASSLDEYHTNLKRLASLVKENWTLIISDFTHATSEPGSYEFMGKKFDCFNSTDEDIVSTLKTTGFPILLALVLEFPEISMTLHDFYIFNYIESFVVITFCCHGLLEISTRAYSYMATLLVL